MKKQKKIILTAHAKERMKGRGITLKDINSTLNNPTVTTNKKTDGTQEFRRTVKNRTNYVVVEHKKNVVVVVTAGWSK